MKQKYFEKEFRGQMIRGMQYLPNGDGPHPAVVLLHGFTGNRYEAGMMFIQLARKLANDGIMAVTFDFRNSGESDGSFDQMLTSEELADAEHITRYIHNEEIVDSERFGVLGFSLGGLVSACLMAKIDFVKSLVMVAPTTGPNMSRGFEYEERRTAGPFLLNPEFYADLAKLNPVESVMACPRPTRIIHGTKDEAVPHDGSTVEYVEKMTASEMPFERCLIEGGTHCFDEYEHREKLLSLTSEHFQQTLLR